MKPAKLARFLLINTLLLSSTTFAHVSLKGEVMPSMPAYFNWTGFYVGLNAGAVNHIMNITDVDATSFNATIEQVSNPKFTGGFQLGYRYQMNMGYASGVYGIEGSFNFSQAKFSEVYGSDFALYQLSSTNNLRNVGLLQLIGGIAADRTLLFLAAGMSWANITGHVTNLDGIPFFNSFSVSKKKIGTAVGAGIEYAFTDAFTARIKIDVIAPTRYSTTDDVDDVFQVSNRIVQGSFGVNYIFA